MRCFQRRAYATKGKELMFGADAREAMLRGVENLTKVVAVTLGPKGRNVIIEQTYGAPKISKDGVTVAKSVEFADPFENLGAQLVRQVASTTNDVAGDGTTTATVLACSIYQEGFRCVSQGTNPVDIKRGIDAAVKSMVGELNHIARKITTKDEVAQVATISANGDAETGQLIADAMERVGPTGVITCQDGKTMKTEVEVQDGMSIDRGYISPYFVTNTKSQKTEIEDCLVLVHQKKISNINTILPVLNHIAQQGKPLLIVADDVDGEALTTLIINKTMGKIKVLAVKAPGFGDNKNNTLQDMAIFTGAQLISDEVGVTLENTEFKPQWLGHAKRVTATKDNTIILGGGGATDAVKDRVELIKHLIQNETSDYNREKLQERLAKLAGGVAVIKVGGSSDVEVGEKKDRITDALNATRAAVEEGIVAGGGSALLYASNKLHALLQEPNHIEDWKTGVRIVHRAVRLPCKWICDNAGVEGAIIAEKVLDLKDSKMGYDAHKGKFCDMFAAGIVDPCKVVKNALIDSASVASMMMTTEAAVCDEKEKPSEGKTDKSPTQSRR